MRVTLRHLALSTYQDKRFRSSRGTATSLRIIGTGGYHVLILSLYHGRVGQLASHRPVPGVQQANRPAKKPAEHDWHKNSARHALSDGYGRLSGLARRHIPTGDGIKTGL